MCDEAFSFNVLRKWSCLVFGVIILNSYSYFPMLFHIPNMFKHFISMLFIVHDSSEFTWAYSSNVRRIMVFHFPSSFRVFSQWSIKNQWIWANERTNERAQAANDRIQKKKILFMALRRELWTQTNRTLISLLMLLLFMLLWLLFFCFMVAWHDFRNIVIIDFCPGNW